MRNHLSNARRGTGSYQAAAITYREVQVLNLISFGFSTSEIAAQLFIGKETVKSHRSSLLAKLGARNTALLVRRALELGLV